MKRRVIVTLPLAAALAVNLPTAAAGAVPTGAAAPSTGSAAAPTATPRTEVRFEVKGCDGCTISVQRALTPGGGIEPPTPDYWNGPRAKVRNGVATLSVPTAYTQGMSFVIRAPWETGSYNAVTNILLGAKSQAPGTRLSAKQIRTTKRATACWVGTADATATIPVKVVRATRGGLDGPSTIPMSWAKPTVVTVGPWTRTDRGILGNQDAFFC